MLLGSMLTTAVGAQELRAAVPGADDLRNRRIPHAARSLLCPWLELAPDPSSLREKMLARAELSQH